MTLLKAYLMGSDDPYVMAEIYLNQILKMPIQAKRKLKEAFPTEG